MNQVITKLFCLIISLQAFGQWTSVQIPTNASFRALKTSGNDIWVAGTQGTVGHSYDAGKNWEFSQVPQAEKLDFRDLIILNEQEVILMSAGPSEEGKARLFKTSDGGNTWHLMLNLNEPGFFFDSILWDYKNQNGWLLGDPIKQNFTLFSFSEDKVIQIDPSKTPKPQNNEAFFAASGSSMIQIENRLHMIGGGSELVQSYCYDIKKHFWITNPLNIQAGEAQGYFSIAAKNKQSMWAVGGDYRKLNESNIPILTSNNGGKNWSVLNNTPKFYMEKVIWAKPYWIVSGPSQSAAFHEKTKRWKSLGTSPYHNIIQVGDVIWGIGSKGQLGFISLSSIKQLFLSEK